MYSSIKNNLFYLANNSSNIDSLGLVNGKLGLAMNLYYGARFFEEESYISYADNLIDDILSRINVSTPPWFDKGLFGIGWGMLDLVENRILEGDIWETFVEIDDIYMKIQALSPTGLYDRDKGSIGRSLYLVKRLGMSNNDDSLQDLALKSVALSSVDSCFNHLNQIFNSGELSKTNQIDIIFTLWLVLSFKKMDIYPYKINRIACLVFEKAEKFYTCSPISHNIHMEIFRMFLLFFLEHFSNTLSIGSHISYFNLDELLLKKKIKELNLDEATTYLFLFLNFTEQNNLRINLIAQKIVVIIYDAIFEKNQLVDERNLRKNLTNGLWGIVSMLENKSINF